MAKWNKPQYCEWKRVKLGVFETSCSETIKGNVALAFEYNYCPYCGKRIKAVK